MLKFILNLTTVIFSLAIRVDHQKRGKPIHFLGSFISDCHDRNYGNSHNNDGFRRVSELNISRPAGFKCPDEDQLKLDLMASNIGPFRLVTFTS